MGKDLNKIEIEEEEKTDLKSKLSKSKKLKKISKAKAGNSAENKELERKKNIQRLQKQNQKIKLIEQKTELFREVMKENNQSNQSTTVLDNNKLKSRGQRKRDKKKQRLLKAKV